MFIAAPDGVNDIYKSVMAVNSNKTAFKHQYVGYSNYTQYISRDTNKNIITKVDSYVQF